MTDLKLAQLLQATHPSNFRQTLESLLGVTDEKIQVNATHLEPPYNYWAVYKIGSYIVTLKSFFSTGDYQQYTAQLLEYYPDRMDDLHHPKGGIVLAPEINSILW